MTLLFFLYSFRCCLVQPGPNQAPRADNNEPQLDSWGLPRIPVSRRHRPRLAAVCQQDFVPKLLQDEELRHFGRDADGLRRLPISLEPCVRILLKRKGAEIKSISLDVFGSESMSSVWLLQNVLIPMVFKPRYKFT